MPRVDQITASRVRVLDEIAITAVLRDLDEVHRALFAGKSIASARGFERAAVVHAAAVVIREMEKRGRDIVKTPLVNEALSAKGNEKPEPTKKRDRVVWPLDMNRPD